MQHEYYERHAATLAAIAQASAAQLITHRPENGWQTYVTLTRPGNTAISVGVPHDSRGARFKFSPAYITGAVDEYNQPRLDYLYGASITTAANRPAQAIAADLERRAWPAARKYAADRHVKAAADLLKTTNRQTRLETLGKILNAPADYSRHNHSEYHIGPLRIHEYDLDKTDGDRFTLTVTARHWAAVELIARILASNPA